MLVEPAALCRSVAAATGPANMTMDRGLLPNTDDGKHLSLGRQSEG